MSTIGGKDGWRSGGDTGRQQFNLSQERWDTIFGGSCTSPEGCRSCPDVPYCTALREECGLDGE